MLVLSRRPQEKILVGDNIEITVVQVHGNRVRLGIAAPDEVRILRSELLDNVTRGESDDRIAERLAR